jgi:hypothetical protein
MKFFLNVNQGYLSFLSKITLICLSILITVFLINHLVLNFIDPRLKVAAYTYIAKYNTFNNSSKNYNTLDLL